MIKRENSSSPGFLMSGDTTINGTKELFVDVICRTTVSQSELRREIPYFQSSWIMVKLRQHKREAKTFTTR